MTLKYLIFKKIAKNTFVHIQQMCLYQHMHYRFGNIFTGDLGIQWRIVIFFFLDKLRTRIFGEHLFPNYVNVLQFMIMLRWKCITFSETMGKINQIPSFWCIIQVNTVENYCKTRLFFISFKFAMENAQKIRTLRS